MSSNVERLDPRVVRTRKLLMDAFDLLLREKRFDEITVNDITERATVNRATFYAHYRDKYALLDHTMHEWFKRQLEGRLLVDAGLTTENLRRLILAVCGFLTDVSGQCRRMEHEFEALIETQIRDVMRDILHGWIEKEVSVSRGGGVSSEIVATVASWSIFGAALQWSRGRHRSPAETFAHDLLPLIAASLGEVVELEET